MTTSKILDNTVISAFINELKSIELLDIFQSEYYLVTTDCIHKETLAGFSEEVVTKIYKNVGVFRKDNDKKYNQALDYLKTDILICMRASYLHSCLRCLIMS